MNGIPACYCYCTNIAGVADSSLMTCCLRGIYLTFSTDKWAAKPNSSQVQPFFFFWVFFLVPKLDSYPKSYLLELDRRYCVLPKIMGFEVCLLQGVKRFAFFFLLFPPPVLLMPPIHASVRTSRSLENRHRAVDMPGI